MYIIYSIIIYMYNIFPLNPPFIVGPRSWPSDETARALTNDAATSRLGMQRDGEKTPMISTVLTHDIQCIVIMVYIMFKPGVYMYTLHLVSDIPWHFF